MPANTQRDVFCLTRVKMCRTATVTAGGDTRSVTVREDVWTQGEEVGGDWRKVRNEELLDVCFSRDVICAVGQMCNAFHW